MMKKTLALALALLLVLGSLSALAEAAAPTEAAAPAEAAAPTAEDPVLATVGDTDIRLSEVDQVMPQLRQYVTDPTDYAAALQFLVRRQLMERKIADMGFDKFSDEELAAFQKDGQAQWEQGIESYVTYYLSEDTEEARAELRTKAEQYFNSQGFSLEELTENVKRSAAVDRMTDYLVGNYEPSQEEIDATFQQYGASYQKNYEGNIMAYEYNTIYGQQPSWYTPSGYRGIIHILLQPDAALLDSYAKLQSAFEEQQNFVDAEPVPTDAPEVTIAAAEQGTPAPTLTPTPVTQEQVDAARQAILDAVKADTDAIYQRIAAGEAFEKLIEEFGKDPGMQDKNNLTEGYRVHQESVVWDPAFTKGAFSEKMTKPGDVSDPVVSAHGVHILKYLRDVPSGLIMTDAIRSDIVDYLRAVKENQAYTEAYAGWEKEIGVTYDQAAIDQATQAAQARQQAEPEGGDALEALPADGEAQETPAPETVAP